MGPIIRSCDSGYKITHSTASGTTPHNLSSGAVTWTDNSVKVTNLDDFSFYCVIGY